MKLDFVPVFERLHQLLWGALNTVWFGVAGMAAALLVGAVCAAASTLGPRWLRGVVAGYIDFFRGTPLLTQIIAAFYGPALLGFDVPPTPVGIVCLGLYFGAYVSEILRAAMAALPSGQVDVARAFGMPTPLLFRRIVLPQVLAAAVPPLTGQFANLVKATSLLSVISINELTLQGRMIIIQTIAPLETYLVIAAIYFVINSAIAVGSVQLEIRFRRHF
jgi:His/Glu/Gln/Arg/opine family amino acid ABC transporter permease subunit